MRRVLPIVAVVVVLLLATATTALAKPQGWTTICSHVVQPGDTLYSIARRFGIDVEDIRTKNKLPDADHLRAGQRLRLQ